MSDALSDARAAELRIVVESLPLVASLAVLSEYDRGARTIRVNVRALERVRAAMGEAAGANFVATAVAHELYHHGTVGAPSGDRRGAEVRAEEFVRERYGLDPSRFEALFR